MKKICLQAGHQNAKENCNPILARGTGAPGEAEFTVRIRDRLSEILINKGFQLFLKDATYNCDPTSDDMDYDLFLAIHYDADIYGNGGGFVDFPEPSTDYATDESQRICRAIESEYFNHSGIENKPQRRNANTKYYYMWKQLSANTPCNIIECGVGLDEHDSVILADTDRVCNAIARGICKAFDVAWEDEPTPEPEDPCKELKEENANYERINAEQSREITKLSDDVSELNGKINIQNDLLKSKNVEIKDLESEVDDLNAEIAALENETQDEIIELTLQVEQLQLQLQQCQSGSYNCPGWLLKLNEWFCK